MRCSAWRLGVDEVSDDSIEGTVLSRVVAGRVSNSSVQFEGGKGIGVIKQLKAVDVGWVLEEEPEVKGCPADSHGGASVIQTGKLGISRAVSSGERGPEVGKAIVNRC